MVHGFYSRTYLPEELRRLDQEVNNEFKDEINLARVNAARLAEKLKDYKKMELVDIAVLSNGLVKYLQCFQNLSRAYHHVYRNSTPLEEALAELRKIPPEID